jgi:hypothetical protein
MKNIDEVKFYHLILDDFFSVRIYLNINTTYKLSHHSELVDEHTDSMPMPSTSNESTTWVIGPISDPKLMWGAIRNGVVHSCSHCHVVLLTGERLGFCCGPNSNRLDAIPPLPPLPFEFYIFLNDPLISHLSRKLNLLYSFASMESSHTFPSPTPPSFLAIAGRIYHRIRDNRLDNSAIRWILYDGFDDAH